MTDTGTTPASLAPAADASHINGSTTGTNVPFATNISAQNPFRESAATPQPAAETSPPSSTSPAVTEPRISATDAPPASLQQRDGPVDPRVVALRAMFPDYDDLVLQSVLESVGGDQDRAIDALLGMTDPDYRSEAAPVAPPMSQTDLDEQLARRLMIEEQEQEQALWQAQAAQRPQQQLARPHPQFSQQQPQSAGTGGGDTMAEFQQQFNKIAETGKKTFGTIFSKVKAKIQEFDQPRQSNQGTQPTWGSSSGYEPDHHQQSSQVQYQSYQPPQGPPQQQPAYYDPNAYSGPPQRIASPPPIVPSTRPAAPPGIQGYDTTPDASRSASPSATLGATPSPANDTPRPPGTGSGMSGQAGAAIDAGKFGLLPKRPVSLLRPQSPPVAGSHSPQEIQRNDSEDSDGLEYAENPFEEKEVRK